MISVMTLVLGDFFIFSRARAPLLLYIVQYTTISSVLQYIRRYPECSRY